MTNEDTVKWIKINGFSYIEIEEIGRCFNLHPLVLENIKSNQRPKIEEYNDYFFLVLKYFNKSDHGIITKQISFVMGEHFVITIQDEETDLFDSVEKQIKISESLIRNNGADFLLYFLLNAIMESNFVILEGIEDKIGHIEKELAYKANEKTLISINELKRDIITLKKAIWPLKEMSSTLKNSNFFLISDSANLYLRDVYDHSNMVSEMLDTFRDTTSGMHDTYLSVMSNNLNDIVTGFNYNFSDFCSFNFPYWFFWNELSEFDSCNFSTFNIGIGSVLDVYCSYSNDYIL